MEIADYGKLGPQQLKYPAYPATGDGLKFTSLSVMRIRQNYKLKSRPGRLKAKGLYTRKQMQTALGISSVALQKLKDHGLIRAYQYGDGKSNILYVPPTKEFIEKLGDMKRRRPRGFVKSLIRDENAQEVQYEA